MTFAIGGDKTSLVLTVSSSKWSSPLLPIQKLFGNGNMHKDGSSGSQVVFPDAFAVHICGMQPSNSIIAEATSGRRG